LIINYTLFAPVFEIKNNDHLVVVDFTPLKIRSYKYPRASVVRLNLAEILRGRSETRSLNSPDPGQPFGLPGVLFSFGFPEIQHSLKTTTIWSLFKIL